MNKFREYTWRMSPCPTENQHIVDSAYAERVFDNFLDQGLAHAHNGRSFHQGYVLDQPAGEQVWVSPVRTGPACRACSNTWHDPSVPCS